MKATRELSETTFCKRTRVDYRQGCVAKCGNSSDVDGVGVAREREEDQILLQAYSTPSNISHIWHKSEYKYSGEKANLSHLHSAIEAAPTQHSTMATHCPQIPL